MKETEQKIALVAPDNPGTFRSSQITKENLALGYLAAQLETIGHKVEIYDARLFKATPEEICEEIVHFNPLLVGISLITEEATSWTRKFTSLLRQTGLQMHVTLGGYFPSLQSKKALNLHPEANSVVIGEGEISLTELVSKLASQKEWAGTQGVVSYSPKGEIVYGPPRPLIENLDQLPFPNRYGLHLVPEVSIEGSRGCFGNCSFCAIRPHFRAPPRLAWRGRSPENIIKEISQLRKRFPHLYQYRFADPDFVGTRGLAEERLFTLAHLIKQHLPGIEFYIETRPLNVANKTLFRELKEAGLTEVYIGIESGSERVLNLMRKGTSLEQIRRAVDLLQELNINYQYGFMMFTPWSEEEDIRASVEFLRQIGAVQIDKLFYEMYVIPGTPAVDQIRALGLEPIEEMVNTGYLKNAPPLVQNLRFIGKTLETEYFEFLTELWSLFKILRPYVRKEILWANLLEKNISSLYLDIFDYCLESAKTVGTKDPETIRIILNSCVSKFQPKVKELVAELDMRVNGSYV